MRHTQQCPKCSGRKLAVLDEFRQPSERYQNTIVFRVIAMESHGWKENGGLGSFETWICLKCGYTEFYARHLKGIEELAAEHPERVRILDTTSPKQGPYR